VRRLLDRIGNPALVESFHGWMLLAWLAASVPLALSPLAGKVRVVTWLSLWALVLSHFAAFQSARIERRNDAEMEELIRRVVREELAHFEA
jgi:hypothetical protein